MTTKRASNVSLARHFDQGMVGAFMAALGLEPGGGAPVVYRVGARSLQLDVHPWGNVCYASNSDGDHVTWVEYEAVMPALPAWAREVRARIRPRCLGHHEGDHVCDGGEAPDGTIEPACAWRERCLYAQAYAQREDRPLADVVAEMTDEAMLSGAAARIQQDATPRHRELEGVPYPINRLPLEIAEQPGVKMRQPAPTKPSAPRPAMAIPRPNKKKGLAPEALASHSLAIRFVDMVALRSGWMLARDKYRAVQGNLLITDKSVVSKYINLYIKQGKMTRDIKVIAVLWVRKTGAKRTVFNVQLHTGDIEWVRAQLPQFDIASWMDAKRPCTAVKGVEEEHIGLVADVLIRAVQEGRITNVRL